jgi:hypothetical protein
MIDWFTGLLGYTGSGLQGNLICEVTPGGDLLWVTEKKTPVRSSYDSSLLLGKAPSTPAMRGAAGHYNFVCAQECLYVSGNPSKWLQGHNVFGPSVAALGPVVQAVVRTLPVEVRPEDADSELWPAVHRSRVDITVAVDLESHRLVHDWLRTAASSTRSRHGRALVSGDTVYWGKSSRRWTMKAYCKFCELVAHPPADGQLGRQLREWCEGHLRLELTLRGIELKPRGSLDEGLVWEYMRRLEIGVMREIERVKEPDLPRAVGKTLSDWMAGKDVRWDLPKSTYYWHRRKILDKVGVDISLAYDAKAIERAHFDLDSLQAREVKIPPGWLQGRLFNPGEHPRYARSWADRVKAEV